MYTFIKHKDVNSYNLGINGHREALFKTSATEDGKRY